MLWCNALGLVAGFGLAGVGPVGCSGQGAAAPPSPLAGAAAAEVSADWDDIEAAVAGALGQSELVGVRLDRSDPDRLVYTLRTRRDEPAVLAVTRLDSPGSPDPVRLGLACSVGRFGDAAREREFLGLVAARLEQLRGVAVAPLED